MRKRVVRSLGEYSSRQDADSGQRRSCECDFKLPVGLLLSKTTPNKQGKDSLTVLVKCVANAAIENGLLCVINMV